MVGRGLSTLRRKSWQLVTLNRFFQKSRERSRVVVDTSGAHLTAEMKAELQMIQSSGGKYTQGFVSHVFQNGDKYDGEWKDCNMHGKGVFHYRNGNEYTGYFQSNKKHGQGTYANKETGNKYEGQWKEDKRHGRGRFTDKEGNNYDGEWYNNDMCGRGKYTFINGDIYEGEFAGNDFGGFGRFTYGNGDYYEGEWKEGKCHGQGKFAYPSIAHEYDGSWVYDRKQGFGKYTAPDYTYEGEWLNDSMAGHGEYAYPNGDKYVGSWVNNEEHGKGIFYHSDGSRYDGFFENGKRNGTGTFFAVDGSRYEGEWADNVKKGDGTYYYPNGDKYSGGWADDQMHGRGLYSYKSGKEYFVQFENGKCIKKEKVPEKNDIPPPPVPKVTPRPPTSENKHPPRKETPKEPTDEERALQHVSRCRDEAVQLVGLKPGSSGGESLVKQAREDMQLAIQFMTRSVSNETRGDLSSVIDLLREELQTYDEEVARIARESRILPQIGTNGQDDEPQSNNSAHDSEAFKKRIEDMKRKKAEKEEMDALNKSFEKQHKEQQQALRKLEKDPRHEPLEKKIAKQKDDIERLKREIETFQRQAPQIELLRKQIEQERKEREEADQRKLDARKRAILEQAEFQKNAIVQAEKRSISENNNHKIEEAKKKLKNELVEKMQEFKGKWDKEHKSADDKEAYLERLKNDYEQKMFELEARLKHVQDGPTTTVASTEEVTELKKMRESFQKEQQQRRKLYNDLAELKGSVRIFVRVRDNSDGKESLAIPTEELITVLQDKKKISFEFERIFTPNTSLDEVYSNAGAMVGGVFEGNNVGIVCYGYTGAGKTYTMLETPDSVVPRAVVDIFKTVEDRIERDKIEVEVGVYEVNGEKLRDLITGNSLGVDSNPNGNEITGLSLSTVSHVPDTMKIISKGSLARSPKSSLVVQFVFNVKNFQSGQTFRTKLCLVDLVGGETDDSSLVSLQEVFAALSKKSRNVPYGNSMLTNALKDILSGKSLILATVSNALVDQEGALSTLIFCSAAKGEPYDPKKKK